MSSRKKSKGQKGKKVSIAPCVSPEKILSGGPGNGNTRASPMPGDRGYAVRSPAARVVYYDPAKELPPTDGLAGKRIGLKLCDILACGGAPTKQRCEGLGLEGIIDLV